MRGYRRRSSCRPDEIAEAWSADDGSACDGLRNDWRRSIDGCVDMTAPGAPEVETGLTPRFLAVQEKHGPSPWTGRSSPLEAEEPLYLPFERLIFGKTERTTLPVARLRRSDRATNRGRRSRRPFSTFCRNWAAGYLLPSCMAASVMQDSTRRPSTCTVHAPHSPRSHPFFVPVSASSSRKASSSVMRGSIVSARV